MLVPMSRINWKPDFARLSNAVLSNAVRPNTVRKNTVQICRSWICLPLLILATPLCSPSLSEAQQNDRSVLVLERSTGSAGSNAQVELEADIPNATGSTPSFGSIPASNQPFLPPSPPASMTIDSDNAASFRRPSQVTLTAASATETQPTASSLSQTTNDSRSELATSVSIPSPDSGTFASRLPSDTRVPGGSDLQVDNSFGSPPASSVMRSGSAGNTPRNRFGDFDPPPSSRGTSRFTPVASSSSVDSKPHESAPPTQLTNNRVPQPPVVSASTQRPAATSNRFNATTAPSNRFAKPSPPSATAPQTSRPTAPAITTRPIPTPPASSQSNLTRPAEKSQSVFSLNDSPQSSKQMPAAPSKFSMPPASRPVQSTSGQSSSFENSNLRSASSSNSRSNGSNGAGFSNGSESPRPMLRRQASSTPASSFSNSSGTSQSSTGSSRMAPQTSRFSQRPQSQSSRGSSVSNELRNNSTNNQSRPLQRSAISNQPSAGQANGKADRASINFAKQLLSNIQPASAGASGTPVRLQEMLLEPLTGSQRKQMVAQYWETYYDLAALKISSDYAGWLNSVSTSGSEQGLLSAAQQMAADQQLAAKIQLGKSQSRLMDFMPNPRPSEFIPLPADEPLIGHYVTDYEKYKRVRTLPSSLRGIDPMLASTLKLITQRAATASSAKNAADQASRNRQIPLASTIAAGQLWRDSQLDMVASTVSYNQAISDFVLTLEPNRSPEQLTAFMLGAPKNGSQPRSTNPQNQSTRSANQLGYPPNRQIYR